MEKLPFVWKSCLFHSVGKLPFPQCGKVAFSSSTLQEHKFQLTKECNSHFRNQNEITLQLDSLTRWKIYKTF